jgi:hypothetical protein
MAGAFCVAYLFRVIIWRDRCVNPNGFFYSRSGALLGSGPSGGKHFALIVRVASGWVNHLVNFVIAKRFFNSVSHYHFRTIPSEDGTEAFGLGKLSNTSFVSASFFLSARLVKRVTKSAATLAQNPAILFLIFISSPTAEVGSL